MSALAIDINDAGIAVASTAGVLAVEPGFALVERGRIVTGRAAREQARLRPRQTSSRFWGALSLEPGSAGVEAGRSAAELAFAQLAEIWGQASAGIEDAVLVVPGSYGTEQLGLLLGLAQECGLPVRALVDVAAAASVRPYPQRQLMYIDAGLHRVTLTVLEQSSEVAIRTEHALAQTGLSTVADAFARRIAEMFVLATRFDPFHHAESEQLLYNRLPDWLSALQDQERAELELEYGGESFRVTAERSALLGVAGGFYRAVTQLIAQHREPGRALALQVSDRLTVLPGLAAELDRLDATTVEYLPVGHAARAALSAARGAASGEQVKLLKRLPWRAAPAEPRAMPEKTQAAASVVRRPPPTHVVYRGTAFLVGNEGLVIGRERVDDRRALIIDERHGGVSRAHCEIVLRDGELRVRDLSRYGTFVNERRISGETVLEPADVIRIGSPGAELEVVTVEQG